MGIAGTDPATTYAIVGQMRCGASRVGYIPPCPCLSIAGTQYATGRADDTKLVRDGSLTYTERRDGSPNTCSFETMGFEPSLQQEVILTHGSKDTLTRRFAGRIDRVVERVISTAALPVYSVSASDYTAGLNNRKVLGYYAATTVATIAASLMATAPAGYTLIVDSDIGATAIDEFSVTNQDRTAALTQLVKRVGGYWRCDYHQNVRLYFSDTSLTNPHALTDTGHPTLDPNSINVALTTQQIINRVWSEGGGTNAVARCAVGETILPVDDAVWYSASGGYVTTKQQRITYTGKREGGAGALVGPGAGPSSKPVLGAVTGSGLNLGAYQYAYTFVTGAGESLPSPAESVTTATTTYPAVADPTWAPDFEAWVSGGGLVDGQNYSWKITFSNAVGETLPSTVGTLSATAFAPNLSIRLNKHAAPTGATSWNLYRTHAGGGTYYLVAAGIALGVPYTDTKADAALTVAAPGSNTTAGTVTQARVGVSGVAIGPTGTTSRKVYRTVVGGTQLKLVTTLADNTTTTYTDSTADGSLGANAPVTDSSGLTQPTGIVQAGATSLLLAGAGAFSASGGWARIGSGAQVIRYAGITGNTLTGIPASGDGSITASISYNSTVTACPCLIGIPASGEGSIVYAINPGDPINLLVRVDDPAAQSALATLVGSGDGIIEDYISDNRMGLVEAQARGQALLNLHATVNDATAISYRCRDANSRVGATVTCSLGAPFHASGDFKVQEVRASGFTPALWPTYDVTAAKTLTSFEDAIRQVKGTV